MRPVPIIRLTTPNGQEDDSDHPPPIPLHRRQAFRVAVTPLPSADQGVVSSDIICNGIETLER